MSSNQYVRDKHFEIAPDEFNSESIELDIPLDFIISRKPDGKIKSIYTDNVWDFTAYSVAPCKFTFQNHGKHLLFPKSTRSILIINLREEMKRITFLLMHVQEVRNIHRRGLRTKIQSFNTTFVLLRKFTKAAAKLDISLNEAAENKQFYIALCSATLHLAPIKIGGLTNLILQLRALNELGYKGVPAIVSEENYEQFFQLATRIKKQKAVTREGRIERTALIPTRILSNLIVGSMEHLRIVEPYLDGLAALFQEYQANPHFWCRYSKDFKVRNNPGRILWDQNKAVHPKDALAKHGLSSLIERFPISTNQSKYHFGVLIGFLSTIQSVARLLCHAFSGMRFHELNIIPFNTLEKLPISGLGDVHFLRSHTSKIGQDNYSKPTYWVTSPELESVIAIAQKVAVLAAIRCNIPCSRDANFPLFPSLSASVSNIENHIHYEIPLPNTSNSLSNVASVVDDIQITEEDLKELEAFDMFRDWRNEKEFALGANWPTASHQFRRSLAVYAARSGLVSLPSLSTHYKHMTLAMTALYAENSAFAVNMINKDEDETHREQKLLVDEFAFHQRLNQSIIFDQKVMQASSRLSGGMGSHIQRLKDKGNLPIWLSDRTEREKRTQDGRLHYRETMVGGCMKPSPCEKAGLGGVSPCTDCEFSIFDGDNGEKNQAYKESLELSIEYMEPNTPAYTAVMADIERISLKQLDTEKKL
jgi:hypothetical protein